MHKRWQGTEVYYSRTIYSLEWLFGKDARTIATCRAEWFDCARLEHTIQIQYDEATAEVACTMYILYMMSMIYGLI